MNNKTQLVSFKKLCYGAQFKYSADDAAVWVKIGHNTVAGWEPKYVSDSWVGQPICAFAEDDQLDTDVFLFTPAPAEDVRAVVEEPVAFHMGDAMALEKLLKVEQVSRHVRNEELGPMGATIVTEYTTKLGLRLVTEYSNGGCSAYLASAISLKSKLGLALDALRKVVACDDNREYNLDSCIAEVQSCLDAVEELNK